MGNRHVAPVAGADMNNVGIVMMPRGHINCAQTKCSHNDHIHISQEHCALLVYGFIRRIDSDLKDVDIAEDLYNECWTHFKALCSSKTDVFDIGDFHRGFECQIDALELCSKHSRDSINMHFEYHFDVDNNGDSNENHNADHTVDGIESSDPSTGDTAEEDEVAAQIRWIWLDFKGEERDYSYDAGTMSRQRPEFVQQTYVTHPWKLWNKQRFLGVYVPTSPHHTHAVNLSSDPATKDSLLVKFEAVQ